MRFWFFLKESANILPALVLLQAAALKTSQLMLQGSSFGPGAVATGFEWVLGCWLLSGVFANAARAIGILVFGLFFSLHAADVVPDCPCFGDLRIGRAEMMMLISGCIAALCIWSPMSHSRLQWFTILLKNMAICAGLILLFIYGRETDQLISVSSEQNALVGARFLEMFPVRRPAIVDTDHALVVLYREDCPTCKELLKTFVGSKSTFPVVFLELPPYSGNSRLDDEGIYFERLNTDQGRFLFKAPLVMTLSKGVIVSSGEELDSFW